MSAPRTLPEALAEIEALTARLEEVEQTIEAIRQGQVDAVVVSGHDGERVFTLEGAERAYRTMIEAMSDGAVITDLGGRIQYCNRSFAEIVRASETAALGRSITSYLDLASAPVLLGQLEGDAMRREVILRSPAGETRRAFLSARRIQVRDRVEAVYFVVTDISVQRAAEEALGRSEQRYRLMAESMWLAIWTAGADGVLDYLNGEGQRYCGVAVGVDWMAAVHPEDRAAICARWNDCLHGGHIFEAEFRLRRDDGVHRWHMARALPLYGDDGAIGQWLGSHVDVDDLKLARQEAEQSGRMKAAFLANMSHEIRTPMNAVIGMTSILLASPLTAEQADAAEVIRSSGDHLLTIINDILDYSKIDAGQLRIEEVSFRLSDCVEGAIDLVVKAATAKGLDLGYLIHPGTPEMLRGDIGRVRQVLLNLLSNAVKFTPAGGSIGVDIRSLGPVEGAHRMQFEVRDSGIGIAADKQERLFSPFMQADASTTRRFGGTGLGLSISGRLVELMGGEIRVESEPGVGALFVFTIVATAVELVRRRAVLAAVPAFAGRRVLIVDGSEVTCRTLRHYVSTWGMSVEVLRSAEQVLAAIRAAPAFDLVVIHHGPPALDAAALAHDIRALAAGSKLPLVAVGLHATDPQQRGLFAGHLTRPIRPSRLLDLVEEIIDAGDTDTVRIPPPAAGLTNIGIAHPLRVLVAEDNVVNQKVVRLLLDKLGYAADFAANGLEAVAAVERQIYDVVLMDVQMPEMDGIEATRTLVSRWPRDARPRIVGLTANATDDDRRACLDAGMDDYLSKPVAPPLLAEALKRVRRRAE